MTDKVATFIRLTTENKNFLDNCSKEKNESLTSFLNKLIELERLRQNSDSININLDITSGTYDKLINYCMKHNINITYLFEKFMTDNIFMQQFNTIPLTINKKLLNKEYINYFEIYLLTKILI